MALVASTNIDRMRGNAKRFASGFTSGQKAAILTAIVGVVAVLAIFMSITSKPSYSILFTNLQPQDAAAITTKLASDHVPYQLQNGGTTILVPQNDVDQERLAAAAAGLPSQSTVGLSILDKEGLTTSQLTQQADYLQGLQGELEQTINSIQGITGSQVSIAMSANQTFALGTNNPTGASVLVDLQPGTSLSYTQVHSITNLVASAVPGLKASEVTLSDNSGNLLAGPGVADNGAMQNGAQQSYDSAAAARLEAYLTGILGPGNADVSVNAQLNFNQVNTTTQSVLAGPGGKLTSFCTNTQNSSTKYSGSGAPSGATVTTIAGNGTYSQTSTTKTCETATQNQTVVQAPGTLQRQMVAVIVNSKTMPQGLSLAQLQKGVAAAAGIVPSRGDVLSFSAAAFKPVAATPAAAKASMMTTMMKPALSALLLIIFVVMLLLSSRKAKKRAAEAANNELTALPPEWLLPRGSALDDDPTLEMPAIKIPRADTTISDLVSRSPEEVAVVLRGMLTPR